MFKEICLSKTKPKSIQRRVFEGIIDIIALFIVCSVMSLITNTELTLSKFLAAYGMFLGLDFILLQIGKYLLKNEKNDK